MVVPVLVAFGRREVDLPAAVLESRCELRSECEKLQEIGGVRCVCH